MKTDNLNFLDAMSALNGPFAVELKGVRYYSIKTHVMKTSGECIFGEYTIKNWQVSIYKGELGKEVSSFTKEEIKSTEWRIIEND